MQTTNASPGPPWRPALAGALDELVVTSTVLADNPLGDPADRPLYVYRSPGVVAGTARDVPAIYLLQAYGEQLDTWLARRPFSPTFPELLDRMFATSGCPDAIVVFVDAWTSLGGSLCVNSPASGRYMDYICDELVPFVDGRYPTATDRARRGVIGFSAGGFGAIALATGRPDVFGGFAAHAPDALFECYWPRDFAEAARVLRDSFEGSYERLFEQMAATAFRWSRFGPPLMVYAAAAAYSPDLDRPGEVLLPFDTETGGLVDDVWERWLQIDPVRMIPREAEAVRSMRHIHLEGGRRDEYFADLATTAISRELTRLGVHHSHEVFDGGHSGTSHRLPPAIGALVTALAD